MTYDKLWASDNLWGFMKIITITAFVTFMVFSIYMLLHEREFIAESKPRKLPPASKSRIIGEKQPRELRPFEIQRKRIESEAVFKFENTQTKESYELREEEMAKFDSALKTLRAIKSSVQQSAFDPDGINNSSAPKDL